MSRRNTGRIGASWRAVAAALAVCVCVAAACSDNQATIEKLPHQRAVSVSTTSTSTTVVEPTTTTVVAETTVPTTVPAPGAPGDHEGEGDTATAPPAEVVRPLAAWVGFGQPQPGSMFENLREDHSLDGKGKFIAFTFDDGPSQYTQPIVDILRFMGVQATFFQIAKQSLARQDEVKLMLLAGMRIGSHTKHHPHLREVTPEVQQDEVMGSIDEMNAAYGPGTVKCFRPPYAQYDQHVLDLVADRQAATAMWSLDTLDWKKPAWTSLVNRIVNGAQDRDVLLFHDGGGDRTQTILALPWIIQGLRDKGFQFIPVC